MPFVASDESWKILQRPPDATDFIPPSGCFELMIPKGNTLKGLVSGIKPSTVNGTPNSATKRLGYSLHLDGSTEDLRFADSAILRIPTTGITILWIGEVTGVQSPSGNYPRFLVKEVNNNFGDPWISYELTATANTSGVDVSFALSTGAAGSYVSTNSLGDLPTNVPVLICARWGHNGKTMTLDAYQLDTGTRIGSQQTATFSGPIGYDASNADMGVLNTNGARMEQYIAGCYLLDRGITDEEVARFIVSPWHPFLEHQWWSVPSGGGGGGGLSIPVAMATYRKHHERMTA